METEEDEDQLLRSVALQNARTIMVEGQRVERQLFEERERLRITLASIGDAVISTDAEGRIVFLNGVAETLTGFPQAEAAGRPLSEIFHIVDEATRLPVENPALRAISEGRVVDLATPTVLISRDGTERPIDDSAAPMKSESGALIGAVLVFRDMTDRSRADEARAQLAAIVQSSEDAILSKTIDGVIRSWNAGAERLFGYKPEETIGRHVTLLIPPDRLGEEVTILERLRRGERIEHFETIRRTKDGRLLDISLTVSPLKDSNGRVVGASKIARDITSRKRAEEALRESEGRHRFLADLAAATQPLTEGRDVMSTTARMLAEYLDVDRCAYAEVEDESVFVISGDHPRGVPSIVGRWPIAAFGTECERRMRANEPYVVHDIDVDGPAGSDLTAYRRANIQAVICVPLHKSGKLVAAMAVHQKTPRNWRPAVIELIRTVVGRSWESLELMRVARGLKEVADRLALAFAAARLGDWSWDVVTDVVTLSDRAAEIFGVPHGFRATRSWLQGLMHEEDRESAGLELERALSTRDPYDVEYRVLRRDGAEVWVSVKGRANYDASGTALGMFGVIQDITE
jgi:PAS domain S-box-containing protein